MTQEPLYPQRKQHLLLLPIGPFLYLLLPRPRRRNFQPRLPARPSSAFSVHLCAQPLTSPFGFSGLQDSGSRLVRLPQPAQPTNGSGAGLGGCPHPRWRLRELGAGDRQQGSGLSWPCDCGVLGAFLWVAPGPPTRPSPGRSNGGRE